MKLTRILGVCAILAFAPIITACSTAEGIAGGAIDVISSLTTSTPSQVNDFQTATKVADATTKTIGWLADSSKLLGLNVAVLIELSVVNDSIHDAWLKLKQANDAGTSLNFALFNAALAAYNTYKAESAIPDAPSSVTAAPTPATTSLLIKQDRYASDYQRTVIALRGDGDKLAGFHHYRVALK